MQSLNKLLLLLQASPKRKPKPVANGGVRLMPAAMATVAVVLGLKAVAVAEDVAETAQHEPAASGAGEEHAATSTPAESGQATAAQCPAPSFAEMAGLSQSEVQVLQALGARREALDQRESEIDTEAELLAAAERRLDERLTELRRIESTVNELLGQLDEAQERRLANLVDVYQRMRAKDAAQVFDGLDDAVLVQVASRMRQQNLAEVMGNMNPQRARALTEMLADQSRPPGDAQELLQRSRAAQPGAGR